MRDRTADYNYVTHRFDVLRYWDERLASNDRHENIYTLRTPLTVPVAGSPPLRVCALDAGVVLDKLVIDLSGLTPTYLGPR